MIPGSFQTPSPIIPKGVRSDPPRMESAKKSPAWNRVNLEIKIQNFQINFKQEIQKLDF